MGVNIKDLIKGEEIEIEQLSGKRIAVDAFNWIVQFLSTIRLSDGSLLMDHNGNVTSHLNGLFFRLTHLLSYHITPWFIFDGPAPKFKRRTLEERNNAKIEALELAKTAKTPEQRALYLRRAVKVDDYILDSSKRLLDLMGIPFSQAPSEGEAEAAYLNKNDKVYAVASQDYDTLIFGGKRLVRNLNITGKRKVQNKRAFIKINPEMIVLERALESLKITQEQLIVIALLIGTDYNGGVKGIGPKKALNIVKNEDISTILSSYDFDTEYDIHDIFDYFLHPDVKLFEPQLKHIDIENLRHFLVEEHDFSAERFDQTIEKLKKEDNRLTLF